MKEKNKTEIPKTRIAVVPISEKEDLVFSLAEPKSGLFLDVRKYVFIEEAGKKLPTKQGWFVSADLATEIRDAMTSLEGAAAHAA